MESGAKVRVCRHSSSGMSHKPFRLTDDEENALDRKTEQTMQKLNKRYMIFLRANGSLMQLAAPFFRAHQTCGANRNSKSNCSRHNSSVISLVVSTTVSDLQAASWAAQIAIFAYTTLHT